MFKCEITGKFSKPGDKAIRLVTERRERFYFEVRNVPGQGRVEDEESDPIGSGWEIAREISVTLEGLHRWVIAHPEDLESSARYAELLRAEQNKKRVALKEGTREELTSA